MAADAKDKDKAKTKDPNKDQGKVKKPKKAKAVEAAPVAAAPAAPAPPPPPRAPSDPRLKVWKKFDGRYLPKGPLRERLTALTTRWASGEEHGGVTYDELKSLHNDWKASREKGPKAKKLRTHAVAKA
jgi:hypothetical protein